MVYVFLICWIYIFDLQQHSYGETHALGGYLDLVIDERGTHSLIENIAVDETFEPSDHFPIVFELSCKIDEPSSGKKKVKTRNLQNLDINKFHENLLSIDICKPENFNNLDADSSV